MPPTLEADVALLQIAAGRNLETPPPGAVARAAPRKAARGRANDLLFLLLDLRAEGGEVPTLCEHLAQLAADRYFKTPGSITAGLREATFLINQRVRDYNQTHSSEASIDGRLFVAVLREDDFYMAQCGPGHAVLLRDQRVTTHTSEEAASRPLGSTASPYIRYYHLPALADDMLILTTEGSPVCPEHVLISLSGVHPALAIERISAAARRDFSGLLIRVAGPSSTKAAPLPQTAQPPAQKPAFVPEDQPPAGVAARPSGWRSASRRGLRRLTSGLQGVINNLGQGFSIAFGRMLPGLAGPPRGGYSPRVLAFMAIAIPLVVVAVASSVYIYSGRNQLFIQYMSQATAAIEKAEKTGPQQTKRAAWEEAYSLLQAAGRYGDSEEYQQALQRVQQELDLLDGIIRIAFQPALTGGLGAASSIKALAATPTDLYILDTGKPAIWRAWSTRVEYQLDSEFQCLNHPSLGGAMGVPVGLTVVPQAGPLGNEGIVALDAQGTVLYCAADSLPALATLEPPGMGFQAIQDFELVDDRLYVLDPPANAIWIYDAQGAIFSGSPAPYFIEEVPNLEGAIDLTVAADSLLILHADGHVDRCRRFSEIDPIAGPQTRLDCTTNAPFQDEQRGRPPSPRIPDALPVAVIFSEPPESSLYFLDRLSGSVFQYSSDLFYQAQYRPSEPFPQDVLTLALSPERTLFVSTARQVYFSRLTR
jgi:hypothetical protein